LAYTTHVQVVVESPDFAADAKAAGLNDDEVRRLIDQLAERPDSGDRSPAPAALASFASRAAAKARAVAIE
jgi:hypothetical protein